MAKRIKQKVAVHGHINGGDKGREIDKEAQLPCAEETTAPLGEVGA
jgi:hypothetical protein